MRTEELFSLPSGPLVLEQQLHKEGFRALAGVDEAGRGALAGPVVAAAVIFPRKQLSFAAEIRDSKRLSAHQREGLFPKINLAATSVGIGIIERDEIDGTNILRASLKAMFLAIEQLEPEPDLCLIDGNHQVPMPRPQRCIIGGDDRVTSIAGASIIAKVTRDRIMDQLEEEYPGYAFLKNKGYGTRQHISSLEKFGPSPVHRRSFLTRIKLGKFAP